MELALGRYPIPELRPEEIDMLMHLPDGVAAPRQDEGIRHSIFELLSYIIDQDPPKMPAEYFMPQFCDFIDICLHVRFSNLIMLKIF